MKKNWLQGLSLLLSIVLLGILFQQNQRLENLSDSLQKMENRLYDLKRDVNGISSSVTHAIEEASRQILDYEIQPIRIDAENRTLEANVVVRLREWSEDSTVEMTAVVGRETFITLLPVKGDGICKGQMSFPVNQESEVKLSASVHSGGVTVRENLGSWSDISMLLPIRQSGAGWSEPYYWQGSLICGNFHISMENQDYQRVQVFEPEFYLYRNATLAQTLVGVELPAEGSGVGTSGSYTVDTANQGWEIPCEVGDTISLHFRCRDEFGLGYEFPLRTWKVVSDAKGQNVADTVEEVFSEGETATLFW